MSIVDKVLGAITPPESPDARAKATDKARGAAAPGDWLSMALDHHGQIRAAFERAQAAASAEDRIAAFKALATVLNGHALAEEVVLYPALAKNGEKAHASLAYTEQTTAKMQMAELERIDPADEAWHDKLEHIQGAVLHHMFEEEGTWFLELKAKAPDQAFLTRRYAEEYGRYVLGVGGPPTAPRRERATDVRGRGGHRAGGGRPQRRRSPAAWRAHPGRGWRARLSRWRGLDRGAPAWDAVSWSQWATPGSRVNRPRGVKAAKAWPCRQC